MPTTLITGITGQDGSYLAELVLEKGYEVHGVVRGSLVRSIEGVSTTSTKSSGLRRSGANCTTAGSPTPPRFVRWLGASDPTRSKTWGPKLCPVSFNMPNFTADVVGLGAMRLLDVMRNMDLHGRFYQASSPETFGLSGTLQDQRTPFLLAALMPSARYPRIGSRSTTRVVRDACQQRRSCSITWRHVDDAPAPDSDDYVIASGETYTIRDFLDEAVGLVGLDSHPLVEQDRRLLRAAEAPRLLGDNNATAKTVLGWEPATTFKELVRIMVIADFELEGRGPTKHLYVGRST